MGSRKKQLTATKTFAIGAILIAAANSYAYNDFLIDEEVIANTSIMTAVRLSQKPKNVPAGVTVITGQRMKDLGISRLPEAMRLVPGIRITQASGWDYRINFHGTNGLIPRRMLVLINGMAVHRYGFAEIDWSLIPLDLEDIERIEVTRNPSSASYGSNAFQQVVNIITKHPQDVGPLSLIGEKGSNGAYRQYLRASGKIASTDFLIGLSAQGDNGFDYVEFDREKEPTPGAVDDHDVERFIFRSNTIKEDARIELNLGWVNARVQDEEVDPNQLAPPLRTQEDKHAQILITSFLNENHEVKVQAYFKQDIYLEGWRACNPTVAFVPELRELADENPNLAWQLVLRESPTPSSAREEMLLASTIERFMELGEELTRPICGSGNQDHTTHKRAIEIDDTFAIGESLRFNVGLGYQNNDITSETYIGGTTGSVHKYLFGNMELLASHDLTINAGFMYEDVSTVDDNSIAPRLGLNYHLTDSSTVRVVYSTGKRMPNILETNRNWSYTVRDWDHEFNGMREGPFFLTTKSPEGLKPETIESLELGLYGSFLSGQLSYDARVFKEKLTDLISEKGTFFDYSLSNENSVDMTGFETEISYRIKPRLELTAGYSYLDSDATNIFEKTLYSRHQGFISIVHSGGFIKTALTSYSQSEVAGESFDRTDLSFTKSLNPGPYSVDLQLTASYLGYDRVGYQWRTDNIARHSYNDSELLKAKIEINF